MDHPDAWPFLEAVDGREVTDYYEIIKDPVDLAMLKRRLVSPAFAELIECYSDGVEDHAAEEASWSVFQAKTVTSVFEAGHREVGLLRPLCGSRVHFLHIAPLAAQNRCAVRSSRAAG
jgi:hypothetical protein